MREVIVRFLRKTIEEYHYKGAVVGVSGGLDSAVVISLCVEALGKDRVLGVILPERDSSPDTLKDAVMMCKNLGVEYVVKPITKVLRAMEVYRLQPPAFLIPRKIQERYVKNKWKSLPQKDAYIEDLRNEGNEEFLKGIAYYRVKHRVRMCYLYLEAERRGYAVVGTTNRTEYKLGFYVKWGDDAVDIEPILHLYKTQVYELAKELDVPEKILRKAPSPDLIPGITDEFAIGMSYQDADRILMKMEKGEDLSNEDPEKVERIREILENVRFREVKMKSLLLG